MVFSQEIFDKFIILSYLTINCFHVNVVLNCLSSYIFQLTFFVIFESLPNGFIVFRSGSFDICSMMIPCLLPCKAMKNSRRKDLMLMYKVSGGFIFS